jgi:sporulation protein YtfJ
MEHEITNVMNDAMNKIKELVDTNTVVGKPILTPDDTMLIPLSRVSFGFASGGTEYPMKDKSGVGAGSGAGVKVEPIGFLVIQNGNVRLLNVTPPASGTVDRLIDMAPQVMDRIDQFLDKRKN